MLDRETTEPITSALCHPKDKVLSDFFCAILSAMIEIAKPIKSEAKWAESVKIATDPAKYPPMS